jgi:hypothetical protein
MKASEARFLVYTSNKKMAGIKCLDQQIREASIAGKFTITTLVWETWGSVYELKDHYEALGFKVLTSHKQTSPNDGDDFITLDWSE